MGKSQRKDVLGKDSSASKGTEEPKEIMSSQCGPERLEGRVEGDGTGPWCEIYSELVTSVLLSSISSLIQVSTWALAILIIRTGAFKISLYPHATFNIKSNFHFSFIKALHVHC